MNRTWANVRNFRNSNLARTRLVKKKKKKKIDPLTKRSHILEDISRDASFVPRDSLTSRETNLAFATLPLALFPAASSLAPHRRNQIETTNRARTGRWSPFESPPGKLFTSRAVDYRFVVLSARSPPLPPFFLSFSLFLSQTFRRRRRRRRKIDRESDRWWKRSYTLCYVSFLLPFRNRVSSSLQFPRSSAKN